MATIYLDPVRMDATAGAVGEHAKEVEASLSTLESTCSAAVPVALVGWLADELCGIAVQAQLVALLYTAAALDTALRAQQIQADQSLVAAQPVIATASLSLDAVLTGAGSTLDEMPADLTIAWVGGPSDLGIVPGTTTAPTTALIGGPMFAMPTGPQNSNPVISALLFNVTESQYNLSKNIVSPQGLMYVRPGTFEDGLGGSGGLGATYRDPHTGNLRF